MKKISSWSPGAWFLAAFFSITLPAPVPAAGGVEVATISFDELERGQKGHGLTVFAGHQSERFEVEVLGIQRANDVAGLDYLMVRLSGHGLEKTGVAGGMSGSPVYFEGRLAGAVAFTYNFASEPIAGITPIGAMRAIPGRGVFGPRTGTLAARPRAGAGEGAAGEAAPRAVRPSFLPRVQLVDLFDDEVRTEALDQALAWLGRSSTGPGRAAVAFTASGFGADARRLLEGRLGPLAPSLGQWASSGSAGGGSATDGGKAEQIRPGDSVAMVMLRGDISMAAVGTLTDRTGDQLLAFGHTIFGGSGGIGPVRFPLATAEVVTVMPGLMESFKIANVGQLAGCFVEDRGAGSRGILGDAAMYGATCPMTPFELKIHPADGGAVDTFKLEVASEPWFRGLYLALGTIGGIAAAGRDQGAQSVELEATYYLRGGHAPVRARHSFAGGQAAVEAALQVMEYASYFAFNDYEVVDLEKVEVELWLREDERRTQVVAAWPDRRKVAPGEVLGMQVEFEDYRGQRRRQRVEFPIPANVAGRFYLMIGDGRSADTAYAQLEKIVPGSLEEGLEQLRRQRSSRDLHIFGLEAGPGLAIAGRPMPDLPPSLRSLYGPGAGTALAWRIAGEKVVELDRPAEGMVRIDLEVERPRGRQNAPQGK